MSGTASDIFHYARYVISTNLFRKQSPVSTHSHHQQRNNSLSVKSAPLHNPSLSCCMDSDGEGKLGNEALWSISILPSSYSTHFVSTFCINGAWISIALHETEQKRDYFILITFPGTISMSGSRMKSDHSIKLIITGRRRTIAIILRKRKRLESWSIQIPVVCGFCSWWDWMRLRNLLASRKSLTYFCTNDEEGGW